MCALDRVRCEVPHDADGVQILREPGRLGHVLLASVDRARVELNRAEEEWLCNEFARRALMPPREVAEYLDASGTPSDFESLRKFCRAFQVSISAAILTLDRHMPEEWPIAFIAASWRNHPKRPREYAYRIDAAATDPRLLVPRDTRLLTLGLCEAARSTRASGPGTICIGSDRVIVLRSRSRGTGWWLGPASWSALVVNASRESPAVKESGGVILLLDTSRLMSSVRNPRQRTRSIEGRMRGEVAAGQLELGLR